MPIGTSDGEYFDNHFESMVAYKGSSDKKMRDAQEMAGNETSGDFESRFGATYASTMPLQASTELAGALKQSGGTQTPGKVPETKTGDPGFFNKLVYGDNPALPTLGGPSASSGSLDITAGDIDTAINVGMGAGPGTLAGVKAAKPLNRLNDLGHAQVLEAEGTHPDVIWKETGFGRGADGRWRHEIDDSKASFDRNWHTNVPVEEAKAWEKWEQQPFNPNEGMMTAKLSDILDHPELYKAYPQLKNTQVVHDPSYAKGGAQWEAGSKNGDIPGVIRMGTGVVSNQGILMHEVQHAVQDIEGFAKGGSPGKAGQNYKLKLTEAIKPVRDRLQELFDKHQSVYPTGLNSAEKAEMDHLTFLANKFGEYAKAGDEEALNYYYRLAGETEARNVDTRLLLTDSERRNINPKWTEDVSREKQIAVQEAAKTTAYGVIDTANKGRLVK